MITKKVGIIGVSGRMGQAVKAEVERQSALEVGCAYSHELADQVSLEQVFAENDVVIDFSHASLTAALLDAALIHPKPLVICTTGWDQAVLSDKLTQLTDQVPVIVATNTSIGAAMQRYLVQVVAKALGDEFDINLHERHHRFKVDSPSGTAKTLIADIERVKRERGEEIIPYTVGDAAREPYRLGVSVARCGSIVGEHEVTFTSLEEEITIKHTAFDRTLFAKGAVRCATWLLTQQAQQRVGQYTIFDVLSLKADIA